ncbi:MAG: hypothetical protein AAFX40_12035 [Cyanobacteria bacterium J06639_1]
MFDTLQSYVCPRWSAIALCLHPSHIQAQTHLHVGDERRSIPALPWLASSVNSVPY